MQIAGRVLLACIAVCVLNGPAFSASITGSEHRMPLEGVQVAQLAYCHWQIFNERARADIGIAFVVSTPCRPDHGPRVRPKWSDGAPITTSRAAAILAHRPSLLRLCAVS